jgi:hypothetical protein
MEINASPKYDMSDNPTGCCPRFNTEGWDDQDLHFKDKLFVKADSRSIFHFPINIASVFEKTSSAIEKAGAWPPEQCIILTYDQSAWREEHLFAVTKEVPGQNMLHLSGDYLTKVFEGPYKDAPKWEKEMEALVEGKGKQAKKVYFFYTTCPKCAKFYGKNYVVAVAEVE